MDPTDVLDLIKTRRSVRKYKPNMLEDNVIEALLQAGRWAPSAGNKQPLEIIVVTNEKVKQDLVEASWNQKFIAQAPVVFVFCANFERSSSRYGNRGIDLYCVQDTAASVQNMMLLANAYGLGTCWIGAFLDEKVTHACRIPKNLRPVALLPTGYLVEKESTIPPRRELKEFVFKDKYGEPYF